MRILRVVHRLYPPTIGGISSYAHFLSADQAKAGHRVVVLTALEGGYPEHEFRDGYEIFRSRALAWPWKNPLTLEMLPKLISYGDDDFDILDAHSHLMFTTNLAAFRKRFSMNPFVITNHGFRVKRHVSLDVTQAIYLATLGRWTLNSADYVVSLTRNERRKVISAGVPPGKAIVILSGVNTQLFRPHGSQKISHSVLWTGRYVAEKGLHFLLQAAKMVTARFPDARFLLVGDGEEASRLLRLRQEMNLVGSVVFASPRSQEEIVDLLNECTLFALPSLSEGFPMSVLEAMSCGKPVVVTSGIGLEEVVGDAGIYARPGDPCSLAKAIMTILGDEELGARLGSRGRERVTRYYEWDNVVSSVNSLFEKAIKEKRS